MAGEHDEEHLVTKHLLGMGLDRPTYRMGTPRLRLGSRFVRLTTWIIPIIVLAGLAVLGAKALTGTESWHNYAASNACFLPSEAFGYPLWLRALHWFDVLLMLVLLKSGIQILADHPRLYRNIHSTPDKEWLRFRGPVPKDQVWTALDDSTHLTPVVGLPGGRHTSGMARHWHFMSVALWILCGLAFIVLLFSTGQWRQIVPTTVEIVPSAVTCAVTYASVNVPAAEATAVSFNSLQLLTYFVVVFIAAPLAILTGIAQAPAIGHRYQWYTRLFGNRQIARSLHFLIWCFFCLFIVVHVGLVLATGLARNMNHIVLGTDGESWAGAWIGLAIIVVIGLLLWAANWLSWVHPRTVQHGYQRIAGHLNRVLFGRMVPRVHWKESQISPYMWPNGSPPVSEEFTALMADEFRNYRLRVFGLVEHPREYSLDELRAMGKHEQITEHDCVQGWSGVAKWGGIELSQILSQVKPTDDARYAIFQAFPNDGSNKPYYDVHDLYQLWAPDSILAYEMNGETLPLLHGAPLRLRNENQVGFKQIKWIQSIELASDYRDRYEGEGGFREDTEFQARSAEI